MNYCINAAWHGDNQPVALLRCYEAQVSLAVAFSSSALLGLVSLIFLLTRIENIDSRLLSYYPHNIYYYPHNLWGSGQASLLVNQAQAYHGN